MANQAASSMAAAVLLVFGIGGLAHAAGNAPPTNVIVTNAPANPVPVTGAVTVSGTTSVNVANTAAVTSGDSTEVVSSGNATAVHGVTDLFLGDLTQYKTVKVIVK